MVFAKGGAGWSKVWLDVLRTTGGVTIADWPLSTILLSRVGGMMGVKNRSESDYSLYHVCCLRYAEITALREDLQCSMGHRRHHDVFRIILIRWVPSNQGGHGEGGQQVPCDLSTWLVFVQGMVV